MQLAVASADQFKAATTPTTMTSSTTASQTELKAAKVPVGWRDQCSAYVLLLQPVNVCSHAVLHHPTSSIRGLYDGRLLIPLNVCRKDKLYMPWECDNERHAYEK